MLLLPERMQFQFHTNNLILSFLESIADGMNTTSLQWIEIAWKGKDFIYHPVYITFYKNIGKNFITAVIPLVSLGCLNYLVYKHLTQRRKVISMLGKFFV